MDPDNAEAALGDSFLNPAQYGVEDNPECANGTDGNVHCEETFRDQDRFLPIANVARIMKNAVPKTGKIAKDAKECVQECVSEFISFITSEASERCHQEKRKTINGEDILFAMNTLGFDNYLEPLKTYLQKYRDSIKGDSKMSAAESLVEELDEPFISTNVLTTDQPQANIIYTTYSASQMPQGNFLQ